MGLWEVVSRKLDKILVTLCYTSPLSRARQRYFRYNEMISPYDAPHRAIVDADGNIILPGAKHVDQDEAMFRSVRAEPDPIVMHEGLWHSPELDKSLTLPWTEIDEELESVAPILSFVDEPVEETIEDVMESDMMDDPIAAMLRSGDDFTIEEKIDSVSSTLWNDVRGQVYEVTNDLLAESGRQYEKSMKDGVRTGKNVAKAFSKGTVTLWGFLTQPVWIPGKNNTPKQYSRGTLFLLDTVRFGGTFASLFVVLFVSLNFQSFWSIAHSYVDPLAGIASGKQLAAELDKNLSDKLKNVPSLTTAGAGNNLTAFLPEVGPPENRLIIPKLDLNVPIMIPANTNLLQENWTALEEDIQKDLQDGVVHYPGTARPGQAGNFFVTGHSSYFPWAPGKYKSVFARLGELSIGDEYWVYYGGDKYRYVITAKKEIKPSDVTVLDQPVSKRVSTLMTCTPVGTTLRRLIINAQEIDPVTGEMLKPGDHATENDTPKTNAGMLPI